jgi:hypothetical protein
MFNAIKQVDEFVAASIGIFSRLGAISLKVSRTSES